MATDWIRDGRSREEFGRMVIAAGYSPFAASVARYGDTSPYVETAAPDGSHIKFLMEYADSREQLDWRAIHRRAKQFLGGPFSKVADPVAYEAADGAVLRFWAFSPRDQS